MMRWAVSKKIAISKPRVRQKCRICNAGIGAFGTIWYLDHEKFKYYCWLHLECIPNLDKELIMERMRNSFDELKGFSGEWGDKTIKCSYCGKRKKGNQSLINLPWFSIHDSCLQKAYTDLKKKYTDNEMLITAGAI